MKYENTKLNEFCTYIKNKKVAIIGAENSNISLLDFLYELKSQITVFDNKEIDNVDKQILDKITDKGIQFSFGSNSLSSLIGFDIIFRSDSIKPDLLEITDELKRGAILTSEVEMFIELFPGKIICVAGSKGKTNTAYFIYEMLKQKEYSCYLGENCLCKVNEMQEEDFAIIELNISQLINMKTSPQISVITNVYDNNEEYKNVFKYQDENGILVLNYDNEITREYSKEANRNSSFL